MNRSMLFEYTNVDIHGLPSIANEIIRLLDSYPCLAISGEMGSGKTTFTRVLFESLGISAFEGSPTYSLIEPYVLPDGKKIYHIDAYRLESHDEAFLLGLDELFEEKAYFVVEWPEKISNFLPMHSMYLSITYDFSRNRNYTFHYGNES